MKIQVPQVVSADTMQRKRLGSFILGLFQRNKMDEEKSKEVKEPARKNDYSDRSWKMT